MPRPEDVAAVRAYLFDLQDRICAALEARGRRRAVRRGPLGAGRRGAAGGRGSSPRGRVFEQAGVNFSHVHGAALPAAATAQRPQLAGRSFEALGALARPPPAQPLRADRPRQRPLLPRREAGRAAGLVVRRRLRPDALLRLRGGRRALAPHGARRSARPSARTSTRASSAGATSTSSSATAASRAASAGSSSTTSTSGASSAASPSLRAVGDGFLDAYLPILRRRQRHPLGRARARLPALPPRPLRRVQPALRPRHPLRPAVRRPDRVDPDVAAAARPLALRLAARAGHARGAALRGLFAPARLGVKCSAAPTDRRDHGQTAGARSLRAFG